MLCVSGFELYARWVPLFQAGDRSVRRKVFSVFSVLLKLPNKRRRPDLSKVRGQGLKTIVFFLSTPTSFLDPFEHSGDTKPSEFICDCETPPKRLYCWLLS